MRGRQCVVAPRPVPGWRHTVLSWTSCSNASASWRRSISLLEHGGVVVVEGRAGIGKTALLEAACGRASGFRREVLRARGSELEAGFAFGVVRQLFERRLASADDGERDALLAGSASAVRSLLLGELVGAVGVRHVVCGVAWALLADRQPRRPMAAADRGRRRALGRRSVVALVGSPRSSSRGGGGGIARRAPSGCAGIGGRLA